MMASISPWRGQGNIAAALRYSTQEGRRNGLAITRSGTLSLGEALLHSLLRDLITIIVDVMDQFAATASAS